MKSLIFKLFLITSLILFILPVDSFSKGGGKSGYKSSHSGHSSSKGGHHSGGSGSSHKGEHYRNPSTSNQYTKGGSLSKGSLSKGSSSKGSSSTYSDSKSKTRSLSNKSSSSISYHPSVKRDSKGRIIRSEEAKQAFLKSRGLKKVPPGYQVDHKVPLYAGGSDTPSNMQLLTTSQHKAKTKADYQRYGR
jgi:hypothetical protein